MSVRRIACFTVSCDACRAGLEPDDYILYLGTEDQAVIAALELGWRIDTDGALFCNRCLAIATCLTDGHDYGPWTPCACRGLVTVHALWGCELLRTCRRDGCDHVDATDLAHLPTTDEPHTFGR